MKNGICLYTLMCGALLAPAIATAQVSNKKIGAQEFSGEVEIKAAPGTVWAVLTDASKLGAALGYEVAKPKKLDAAGALLDAKVWGDPTAITVTLAKPSQELRLSLEPANASYICASRFVLTPVGSGTKLKMTERYTESGPQSAEDLAKQVKDMNAALAKLRASAEANK